MDKNLIDQDFAGWRVETWYELRIPTNDRGAYEVGGYFTDKKFAARKGKGQGWWGGDGKVVEVTVLTGDGKTGFVIKPDQVELNPEQINRNEEAALRAETLKKIRDKLNPKERKFLGIK